MAATVKALFRPTAHSEEHEDPTEHLLLDPRPRGEMNDMVMEFDAHHQLEVLGGDHVPDPDRGGLPVRAPGVT